MKIFIIFCEISFILLNENRRIKLNGYERVYVCVCDTSFHLRMKTDEIRFILNIK